MAFFKKCMKKGYIFLHNFHAFRSFWHNPVIQNLVQTGLVSVYAKKKTCPSWLSTPYKKWLYRNRLTKKMADFIISSLSEQDVVPTFSIVIPVFNTPEDLLRKTMQSIADQIYPHWKACIIDDGSDLPHVRAILEEYARNDTRYRITTNTVNSGLSAATNQAVSLSTGDYCAFLDHDDLLEPDALAQVAWFIIRNPDADLIYTDNDTIGIDDTPILSQFKPGFSPALLQSMHYFNHLIVYRRKFLEEITFSGNYRCGHDYELSNRATHATKKIVHLPLMLSHWRNTPGSVSKSTELCLFESIRILKDSLARSKITWAGVVPADTAQRGRLGIFYLMPAGEFNERISIIITDGTGTGSILPCIQALLSHTGHKNTEIIIITSAARIDGMRNTLSAQFPQNRFFISFHPVPRAG